MPSSNYRSPTFFEALPPYLGGKRRLCPLIFAALAEALPRKHWQGTSLLDPFAGGGAVSLYAKAQGFNVTASDVAERSCIGTRALVANSSTRLARKHILDLFREPAERHARPAAALVPDVFTAHQADWLDGALANANEHGEPVRSLLLLVITRTAMSLQPMSTLNGTDARAVAEGDFDHVSPRRLGHYLHANRKLRFDAVWRTAQAVNKGVFGGRGRSLKLDALSAITSSDAEVLYLDPPYPGTARYDREYAALDRLLSDPPPEQPPPELDQLLDAASGVPWLVLSYGGPSLSLDALADRVARHRPVRRAIDIPYRHLSSLNTKERSYEFLIIAGRE